jgi:hypothetical protein
MSWQARKFDSAVYAHAHSACLHDLANSLPFHQLMRVYPSYHLATDIFKRGNISGKLA